MLGCFKYGLNQQLFFFCFFSWVLMMSLWEYIRKKKLLLFWLYILYWIYIWILNCCTIRKGAQICMICICLGFFEKKKSKKDKKESDKCYVHLLHDSCYLMFDMFCIHSPLVCMVLWVQCFKCISTHFKRVQIVVASCNVAAPPLEGQNKRLAWFGHF